MLLIFVNKDLVGLPTKLNSIMEKERNEMKKIEQMQVTKDVIKSITCDKCQTTSTDLGNFIQVNHDFGYGSDHDTENLSFDLCEKCIFDILNGESVSYRLTDSLDWLSGNNETTTA